MRSSRTLLPLPPGSRLQVATPHEANLGSRASSCHGPARAPSTTVPPAVDPGMERVGLAALTGRPDRDYQMVRNIAVFQQDGQRNRLRQAKRPHGRRAAARSTWIARRRASSCWAVAFRLTSPNRRRQRGRAAIRIRACAPTISTSAAWVRPQPPGRISPRQGPRRAAGPGKRRDQPRSAPRPAGTARPGPPAPDRGRGCRRSAARSRPRCR